MGVTALSLSGLCLGLAVQVSLAGRQFAFTLMKFRFLAVNIALPVFKFTLSLSQGFPLPLKLT